jgi:hypothetical protein
LKKIRNIPYNRRLKVQMVMKESPVVRTLRRAVPNREEE